MDQLSRVTGNRDVKTARDDTSTRMATFMLEYNDGKRSGRGRMYYAAKREIYDGDWSQDRRQGEGSILNAEGQISSGDFRADQMEGKLQHQKTISMAETERIFLLIINQRDVFIAVDTPHS